MKYTLTNLETSEKYHFFSEDLCPCGSGKAFKDCCEKEYEFLGYNYKGIPILMNKKQTKSDNDELMAFSEKEITDNFHVQKGITIVDGINLLEKLNKMFDEKFKAQSNFASCHKGCNGGCCTVVNICTAIEAEAIKRYIRKKFSKEQIQEMEEYNKKILKKCPQLECY